MAGAAHFLVPIAKYKFSVNLPIAAKIKFMAGTGFSWVSGGAA
jgi:hypothetical protein